MPDADVSPLAQALGRVPTGLYLLTAVGSGRPIGLVASFVMQTGFDPPTVCVALGKGREQLAAVRAAGGFALSILDAGSQGVMGAFFKKHPAGESPFDRIATRPAPSGAPILCAALAWLDCELAGEHPCGDHVVVFGRVTSGEQLHPGDPAIHLRRSGLEY